MIDNTGRARGTVHTRHKHIKDRVWARGRTSQRRSGSLGNARRNRRLKAAEGRREGSTDLHRHRLTSEASEAGGGPRELRQERPRNGVTRSARDKLKESLSVSTEGAEGGDSEGDVTNAHAGRGGRRGAEIVNGGLTGHTVMVCQAAGGGAKGGKGGGTGRINSLYIEDDERLPTVQVNEHCIWLLRQARAVPAHPALHGSVATGTRALGDNPSLAKGSGEDSDKGITDMIVNGGVEADTMWTMNIVATIGGMEMRATCTGTMCADRGSKQLRRTEEEVKGESSDVVVGHQEAEAVRDGDSLEPRRGALRHRTIKEPAAALRGGGSVKKGEEVSCCEGGSGSLCGAW